MKHHTRFANKADAIRECVQRVDPNEKSNMLGYTALMICCLNKSEPLSTVRVLLEAGADPNLGDAPPLHLACRNNDIKKIKLLIHYGANVDLQDARGLTALHHSVGYANVVKLLLSEGADPLLLSKEGESPIDIATYTKDLLKRYA